MQTTQIQITATLTLTEIKALLANMEAQGMKAVTLRGEGKESEGFLRMIERFYYDANMDEVNM